MIIEWDVPIEMDDGIILRANIYRPDSDGLFPVIMSHGPYGKDLSWQEGYSTSWKIFSTSHPEAILDSSNIHQSWETVDPEKWVPDGYICIRVDSRGAGRSPGVIDCRSSRETSDFFNCIEWAGEQIWSNGKVGLTGISYYAINQWQVAALKPKYLAAICVWEGSVDYYRDGTHHGGILNTFQSNWYDMQIKSVQHGLGENGPKSQVHGELVCGPETLSEKELEKNRVDLGDRLQTQELINEWYNERTADLTKIETPLLSAASWGGQGLHPRGNYMGFLNSKSEHKWLECHGLEHWTEFYTPYGVELQKKFFGHFLKEDDTGWVNQPPVQLKVRHIDEKFIVRGEDEWPIARTEWTKVFLDPNTLCLSSAPIVKNSSITYDGLGDGVTFLLPPWKNETEITGPLAAKLFVSSSTTDADIFLVVRLFSPDIKEIVFQGTLDPNTPIANGWLRASHRKLDPEKSTFWQPYHTHDEKQPLSSGNIYELDIEIWPTCIVVPSGYRLGLSVRGKDYVYPCSTDHRLSNMRNNFTGVGPFL
ncbi:MAG: CocE/NonD family hydrolase, partial [Alphaproteobacteria bacterium]|nr:CocE/NonD family hydrolase [Alphaproteobacteria bacterium]